MNVQDLQIWWEENWQLFALALIALIPTGLHFALQNAGYNTPFFITAMAINTWFKGIVGISLGILLGFLITKKFGWKEMNQLLLGILIGFFVGYIACKQITEQNKIEDKKENGK